MKTPLLVFGLACLGILAGGCASKMDVTGDPRFSAGWVIGGKYALINDVYLHKDAMRLFAGVELSRSQAA